MISPFQHKNIININININIDEYISIIFGASSHMSMIQVGSMARTMLIPHTRNPKTPEIKEEKLPLEPPKWSNIQNNQTPK